MQKDTQYYNHVAFPGYLPSFQLGRLRLVTDILVSMLVIISHLFRKVAIKGKFSLNVCC